ncbi:MAG: ABC transporter ATP-binding protein [Desulfarculaceae bacterium]|nr:ABC transporter ATP-binding protein [Desulfarculaceae bacterium]MCF8046054.1 ABC transporter ATP-binding protein [Desulfarculaceae bacterium]MCF8064913.1 ABC transporter ATP-binding protein [Desulfarculaceae bacterium]MCF8121226.1 ABC transporter ATP-binding protein [Desulfarculaceae bacterium]
MLNVQDLSKSFSQLRILNNLNFQVRRGELKAIIGPNGAGKTTLFNVITGRFPPDAGKVTFQDKDITGAKPHQLSRLGLARSFQINNFFLKLSVRQNLELAVQSRLERGSSIWRGFSPADRLVEKTDEVLEWTGLAEHHGRLAQELSYGDQRKLEIGLALATDPALLMLDEPTSGMSRFESMSMIELIQKLAERVTIILIEHDIEFVMKVSDSILVIHYGEKIAEGPPKEIEANQEVQRVYLGGL